MSATPVRSKGAERLLNRELSWLDFNARVLELAADPEVPLLERVKFARSSRRTWTSSSWCAWPASWVRRRRASRVRSAGRPDRRRSRSPRSASASVELTAAAIAALEPRAAPRARRGGDRHRAGSPSATRTSCAELARRFDREVYPVLTPLAVGPGQPLPVHLGAVAQPGRLRPRSGDAARSASRG